MAKIRMGIIGVGGISHVHINGIKNSSDAQLVALCDIDEEKLYVKKQEYGIDEDCCFVDYRDLLKSPHIDAVSICTHNSEHFRIAKSAIEYNKPFILEKPVTLNGEQAYELKTLAQDKGTPNMVAFSYRYKPAVRYAKWLIQRNMLGNLYHVYAQYLQSWAIDQEVPLVWRFEEKYSGSGALGDLGSHAIDLVRFLVGDFKRVLGQSDTFIEKRRKKDLQEYGIVDVDDYCHFLAELNNEISATFNISRFAFGRGNYQRIEIYGSKGGLVYTLEDTDRLYLCIDDGKGNNDGFREVEVPAQFCSDQMQSFFDILNYRGDGLSATINDGYVNQLILDSIIESSAQQKWIKIEENDSL